MVEVTKLPPGKAYGADDLRNWSGRRVLGRASVFDKKARAKQRKRAKELSEAAGRVKPFK